LNQIIDKGVTTVRGDDIDLILQMLFGSHPDRADFCVEFRIDQSKG
jgi:hypothetical protein